MNLDGIPDEFNYHLKTRIQRSDSEGERSAVPANRPAGESARERLKLALENGLAVTALDGLFWFGIQRIAADVQRLRKTGMRITTSGTEVFDTLTSTRRQIGLSSGESVALPRIST